jgi:2-methylcitrate dehydratase PrpD
MASAIEIIAKFLSSVPRDQSAGTLAASRNALLDTMGCILLGASAPVTQTVVTSVAGWGEGHVPVFGTGTRLPPPWAAMANGAAAHAFDLDDYEDQGNTHASAVIYPALLALAAGRTVSGRDLLDAHTCGVETVMRIGEAVNMSHYNLGWHSSATIGSFGAAAACCRLLRLNAAKTANALSLTTSMGTGYVSQFGTMAKPLHVGFAAKNGVVAALLAENGATASVEALDGPVSFASLLVEPGEAQFVSALARMGLPWGIEEHGLAVKIHPACGYTHRAIDAALALRSAHASRLVAIDKIDVILPDFYLAILPFHMPESEMQALFSPAYCVASALLSGTSSVEDFRAEAIARPEVRALVARTTVLGRVPLDRSRNLDPADPDVVRVTLANGDVLEQAVGVPKGAPANALSEAELHQKFFHCARHSLSPVQTEAVLAAVAAIADRETLDDLIEVLCR